MSVSSVLDKIIKSSAYVFTLTDTFFRSFLLSLNLMQDLQGEVPSHLLRLKVEVERNRVAVILQDSRAELDRELQALSGTCTSERVIKEHRVSLKFWWIIRTY